MGICNIYLGRQRRHLLHSPQILHTPIPCSTEKTLALIKRAPSGKLNIIHDSGDGIDGPKNCKWLLMAYSLHLMTRNYYYTRAGNFRQP